MADLTSDVMLRFLGPVYTEKFPVDSSVAQTIFKGQPVLIDQSVDAENLTPYVDALAVEVTDVVVGIAAEGKTLAAGASESDTANFLEVYVSPTIVGFPSAVFTNADLGKRVQMSDSATLSETTLANPSIGKLHKVEHGFAYVELDTPRIAAEAGA